MPESKKTIPWPVISFVCPLAGSLIALLVVIAVTLLSGGNEGIYWLTVSVVFYIWLPIILIFGIASACYSIVKRLSKPGVSYIGLSINTIALLLSIYLISPRVQFIYLSFLAHAGHIDSQYQIGTRYLSGQGVLEDNDLGLSWIKRAAEAGHIQAQFDLGSIYDGSYADVDLILKVRDDQLAMKWYRICAEAYGNNQSQEESTLSFNAKLKFQALEKRQNKANSADAKSRAAD